MSEAHPSSPVSGPARSTHRSMALILKQVLADQHILYVKTRDFLWNLVGLKSYILHQELGKICKQLTHEMDQTKTHLRDLETAPPKSMKEFLTLTTLPTPEERSVKKDDPVSHLLTAHQTSVSSLDLSIQELNKVSGHKKIADFLAELLHRQEMTSWFLQNHLKLDSKAS